MTPISYFEAIWTRCSALSALHAYLAKNVAGVVQPDDLLRAEWVARVSALDLYVHELVSQRMLEIFQGQRPSTLQYRSFSLSTETMDRIRAAGNAAAAGAAFDLEVRRQLGMLSFQAPDKIADAIRLCSTVELWNGVAEFYGAATGEAKKQQAKAIRQNLSFIVQRRNKIAHEGDLQPTIPRTPWSISTADLSTVSTVIERIVRAIDSIV